MGREPGWGARATGRPPMRSSGRAKRWTVEHKQRVWMQIAAGATSEDAAVAVGMAPAVGSRWFREAGGMPDVEFSEPTGRYLSFEEREEIAVLRARGVGARAIARELGRAPSTISCELRRNASTWGGVLTYRATVAQWHATAAPLARSRPSSRATSGCTSTSRNGSPARFAVPTARRCPDQTSRRGRGGGGLAGRTAGGTLVESRADR